MRFVDETGEERTLNYKDIAKRNIKKQMTINASRMKEEVKDKANTKIKNSVKNKAVNRIKQNSQLNSCFLPRKSTRCSQREHHINTQFSPSVSRVSTGAFC